jgi:maleate cis-trans isomerase
MAMPALNVDLSDVVPSCRLGFIEPLNKIDTFPYEFYRMAPRNTMASFISIGMAGLKPEDARAAVADGRAERCIEDLLRRGVTFICLNGVPLGLNLGEEYCRGFIEMCRDKYGVEACVSLDAAVQAFHALGVSRTVAVNKWNPELNGRLGNALRAEGIDLLGVRAMDLPTTEGQGRLESGVALAIDLAEDALRAYPQAESLYLVGGAWLMLPLIKPIEDKFGLPVVAGIQSKVWYSLNRANNFEERPEYGHLMTTRQQS